MFGYCMKVSKVLCFFLFLATPEAFTFEHDNYPPEVIQAGSAVYQIRLPRGKKGTGFFIAPDLLVTHFRLIKSIKNTDEISLYFDNKLSPIKVKKLVSASYPHDLAVLKTEGESSAYLSETPFRHKSKGHFWTVGYPNIDALQYHHSISKIMDWNDFYFEAGFNFGQGNGVHGSPVIDSSGNFFGIIFASGASQKFFINSSHLKSLTEGRIGTLCTGSLRECVRSEILRTKEMIQNFLHGGPRVGVLHVLASSSIVQPFSLLYLLLGIRKPSVLNDVMSKKDEKDFLRRLAEDFNSAIAQIWIAHHYFEKGTFHDKAKKLYARAAEQNHPIAFLNLGYVKMTPIHRIYPTREHLNQIQQFNGIDHLLQLFEQAKKLGLPEAEYNQGAVLESLSRMQEAFKHYESSANLGVPQAQLKLGIMLEAKGQQEESQRWLSRAAQQGVFPKKPNALKRGWRGLCEAKFSSLTNSP